MLRRLTATDHSALLDVWRRSGLSTTRPEGRDTPAAFAAQLATGHQIVLGWEEDGVLAGVVLATHDSRKGWINRLAVLPETRHEGIGRRLVAAAEAWLREQGIRVIGALVEEDNDTSLAFFQQVGYRLAPDIRYLSKRDANDA